VAGIVLTIVMALVLDFLLVLLGRVLMPWSRKDAKIKPVAPVQARQKVVLP